MKATQVFEILKLPLTGGIQHEDRHEVQERLHIRGPTPSLLFSSRIQGLSVLLIINQVQENGLATLGFSSLRLGRSGVVGFWGPLGHAFACSLKAKDTCVASACVSRFRRSWEFGNKWDIVSHPSRASCQSVEQELSKTFARFRVSRRRHHLASVDMDVIRNCNTESHNVLFSKALSFSSYRYRDFK